MNRPMELESAIGSRPDARHYASYKSCARGGDAKRSDSVLL